MSLYSVLGMGLLFVGGVLVVNGLWLHGYGGDDDVAIFNLLVGIITFLIVMWWGFGGAASQGTPFNAAGTMLFSFTYLWLGVNAYRGTEDQRGFGWYCAFVAVVTIPTGYLTLLTGDIGLTLLWWVWGFSGQRSACSWRWSETNTPSRLRPLQPSSAARRHWPGT
ncbi:AmiS/UreI family transporter [Halospeciosus flavus]|uniref:AmiS/UreI family transporter n=1 Tax=Halospeciosus flavus TaxID=3032283 RepID=UPI00360C0631